MAKRKPKGFKQLTRYLSVNDRTKGEIAKDCGMSLEQLRHITAGRRLPTLQQAVKIQKALGIDCSAWV